MSMHDSPWEPLNAREGWNIGDRVVTGGHNDIVILLSFQHLVLLEVLDYDSEVVLVLVVDHVPDHGAEGDHLLDILLPPSSLEIVKQDFSWWEGWDGLAIMFLKGVLW